MVESKKEADKKIITLTKKLRKVDDTLESLDDLEERKISLNNNLNSTDEKTLGELFSYFILETVIIGKLIGINPFDQPAVEQVKLYTKKLLS